MDVSAIIVAALVGAVGGGIGAVLSLLFPRRVRPVVIAIAVALAIAAAGSLKPSVDRESMTPERFERIIESSNEGVRKILLLYKEHEPELYRAMMTKAAQAYKEGKDKDAIANIIRTQVANYTASRIRGLSDEGIVKSTGFLIRQFEQLGAEGRDIICMKMLKQEKMGATPWSDEMVELEYQLVRTVVLDKGNPGELADQQTVNKTVDAAIAELVKKYGQERIAAVFGALSDQSSAPDGTCLIFADYFRFLRKAAQPQEASIMRTLFASGT